MITGGLGARSGREQQRTRRGCVVADAVGEVYRAAQEHHADEEPVDGLPEAVQRPWCRHVLDGLVDAGDRSPCLWQRAPGSMAAAPDL